MPMMVFSSIFGWPTIHVHGRCAYGLSLLCMSYISILNICTVGTWRVVQYYRYIPCNKPLYINTSRTVHYSILRMDGDKPKTSTHILSTSVRCGRSDEKEFSCLLPIVKDSFTAPFFPSWSEGDGTRNKKQNQTSRRIRPHNSIKIAERKTSKVRSRTNTIILSP